MTVFYGTAGDDNLTGSSGPDEFILWQGGNDTVHAGDGNDVMRMGAALTAADQLDGGTGRDAVILNGDYSAGLVLGASTITNVEVLGLVGGHSYNLTTNDGNVAAGQKLIVEANGLGAGDTLTFDGSAETDGRFYVVAGSGNDTITGGAQNDIFHLEQGGTDTVHGGNGNDAFYMGTSLGPDDRIDGGTGYDKVFASGFAGGDTITLNSTTMQGVEDFVLGGSSLGVTTNDATVAAGAAMIVDASAVNGFTFDGSAETDGRFYIIGGAGNDTLTGGARRDVFDLSQGGNDTAHGGGGNDTFLLGGAFTASDAIDGGTGDDTLELNGDYSGGFFLGATTFTNIDTLRLDAGHSYGFASNDGNVASGATLTVDASALGSGDTVAFVGSAETDGSFHFEAGAGSNYFIGGAGNDVFDLTQGTNSGATAEGGGGNDVFNVGADFNRYGGGLGSGLAGGDGDDTLNIDGAYATTIQLSTAAFFVDSIETVTFGGGHSYDAQLHGDIATGASLLTLDGSTLGAGDTLSIDMTAGTSSAYAITGGAGNDSFILSGSGANSVTGGLGADHITCGASTDTIVTGAVGESTGAGGYDTIDAFNFDTDKFNLAGAHTVTTIHGTSAFVDSATFDTNLTAASVGHLSDDGVLIVSATTGNLSGHIFLVVDVNNDGLYQAGADYVFDVSTAFGTIDTGDFI